jgi:predicted transcriptional regulator
MLWAVYWFLIGDYKMKRSELRKKLFDTIFKRLHNDSGLGDYIDHTEIADLSYEMAEELLSMVEKQGMLPPAQEYLIVDYKISPKGERYWNGDFAKKYVNEWEPEEKSDEIT